MKTNLRERWLSGEKQFGGLRLAAVICISLGFLFFANRFYQLEYNMSLRDFILEDTWLSPEERAYLRDHGDLIYGADQNSPPLRYVNPETGQYEGLVIDYLGALSMELGVNIQTKPMVWNAALEAVESGETDFCDMYASKARSSRFLFTEPVYYQRGAILVKREGSAVANQADLAGKRIAATYGDYVFEYLRARFDDVKTLETPDLRTAIRALEAGRADAVLGDESVLNYYLTRENLSADYVILDEYLYEQAAVIGVKKSEVTLLAILNKGIRKLNKMETMAKINDKWFGGQPLITKNSQSEKSGLTLQFVLFASGVIALGFYDWNRRLKREVARKTEALSRSRDELERAFAEYRQAEQKMMQSSKMAAVGQLAAGIAHEIRTPLGIIRNSVFLLKRENSASAKQLAIIEQSVDRAGKIIDNLLNFSRLTDDALSQVELFEFVEALWQLNRKAWLTQDIRFELSGQRPVLCEVNAESLKHILLNLFSNAVDAMPEGGQLSVRIEERAAEDAVLLTVSDTGKGMTASVIEKLFDPFFTTKPQGSGTGLGLYIVYSELEKMGGTIRVTSQLGEGSHFVLTLPRAVTNA